MVEDKRFIAGKPVVMAYPARIERDTANVTRISFPDLPEANGLVPEGGDVDEEARRLLNEVIGAKLKAQEPIDRPSKASSTRRSSDNERRYERMVPVSNTVAMKAILAERMRHYGITNVRLAKALGCDEKEIRRLLDPGTESRTRMQAALDAVGVSIAVTIVDTARPVRVLKAPGQSGAYRPELEPVIAAAGED